MNKSFLPYTVSLFILFFITFDDKCLLSFLREDFILNLEKKIIYYRNNSMKGTHQTQNSKVKK
jgi:hypothetical protein